MPEALYVQSVSGLHSGTNPVSGDFSVGAEGLMVRDGEFAEPVREVTIASTLQRMLHDIVAGRRRPHVAPRRRRGHDPARRRDVGRGPDRTARFIARSLAERTSRALNRCRRVKIVSLIPSATEIVFALGLGDSLDGVTFECDYPAGARIEGGRVGHRARRPTSRSRANEIDDAV